MPDPIGVPVPPPSLPKTANPGPLGLAGFGLTTVALCCIHAGFLPHEAVAAVVPLAFAYGGVAQLIAGVLEFKVGNTFGMVAFTSYGLFWWWFALLQWSIGAGWLKAPPPSAGGVILLLWGIFTLLLWIVTFRLSKAVLEHLPAALDHVLPARLGRLRLLHRPLDLRPHRRLLRPHHWPRCPLRSLHRSPQRHRQPPRPPRRQTLPHLTTAELVAQRIAASCTVLLCIHGNGKHQLPYRQEESRQA